MQPLADVIDIRKSNDGFLPYLLRAIYDWCVDSGLTPYISVMVESYTRVPAECVKDGQIELNIGLLAAERFKMGNDLIEFAARFNGAARDLSIPVDAVSAIYARESGHGLSFEVAAAQAGASESGAKRDEGGDTPSVPPCPAGKHTLRRVK